MIIKSRPIEFLELRDLIEFDSLHLVGVMKNLGIAESKCPPALEYDEITAAHHRGDILLWLLVDDQLAGYLWRIKQADCLFSAGAAIKKEFYGLGLSRYIIELTEQIAKEVGLAVSRIAAIPENGRAVNAFMKHGYQITAYTSAYFGSQYPNTFRCIMQKNFLESTNKKIVIDSCEVFCSDENNIKKMIDANYIGIHLIRSTDKNPSHNKIKFQKFE